MVKGEHHMGYSEAENKAEKSCIKVAKAAKLFQASFRCIAIKSYDWFLVTTDASVVKLQGHTCGKQAHYGMTAFRGPGVIINVTWNLDGTNAIVHIVV